MKIETGNKASKDRYISKRAIELENLNMSRHNISPCVSSRVQSSQLLVLVAGVPGVEEN